MKTIVNLLTISRIPLIILFAYFSIVNNIKQKPFIFFINIFILIIIGITDFLDGYLARKYKVTTKFGEYIDPLMDKIFFAIVFPVLAYLAGVNNEKIHLLILIFLIIIFWIRDLIVTFLRIFAEKYNIKPGASMWGKIRTFSTFYIVILIYYFLQKPKTFPEISPTILYIVEGYLIIYTLITLITYIKQFLPAIKKELKY